VLDQMGSIVLAGWLYGSVHVDGGYILQYTYARSIPEHSGVAAMHCFLCGSNRLHDAYRTMHYSIQSVHRRSTGLR
jgi:hypothetical protein